MGEEVGKELSTLNPGAEKGIRAKACSRGQNELCRHFRTRHSRGRNSQGKDHKEGDMVTCSKNSEVWKGGKREEVSV